MPVLAMAEPLAVLGSSQAPPLGTVVPEFARRYSVAWHMCDPVNADAQSECIFHRPPAAPLVVEEVNPAKRALLGVLQQANCRAVPQAP